MAKIIDINDLLTVATRLRLPVASDLVKAAEALANIAAISIAANLDVKHGPAEYNSDFAGVTVAFYPTAVGQLCPEVLDHYDLGGEFVTKEQQLSSTK